MRYFSPFFRSILVRTLAVILAVTATGGVALYHLSRQHGENLLLSRKEELRDFSYLAHNTLLPVLKSRDREDMSLQQARNQAGELLNRLNCRSRAKQFRIFLVSPDGRMLLSPAGRGELGTPWPSGEECPVNFTGDLKSGFSIHVVEDREGVAREQLVFIVSVPEIDGFLGTAVRLGDLRTAQRQYLLRLGGLGVAAVLLLLALMIRALWSAQTYSRDLEAEVARRRRVEQEREISEERYRVVATQPGQAVFERNISTATSRLWGDELFLSMLGVTEGESFHEDRILEFVHPDDREMLRKGYDRDFEPGEEVEVDCRMLGPSGRVMHIEGRGVCLGDVDGQGTIILGTLRDITERKRAEEAILRSEAKYRTLVENFPRGIVFVVDRDMRFVLAEGAGLPRVAGSGGRAEGRNLKEVFPPSVAGLLLPAIREAFAGRENSLNLTLAGRIYDMQLVPVPMGEEQIPQVMGVAQDVSTAKLAENALFESQRKYATLIANMPGMVYRCVYDENRTMEFVSEGCRDLIGYGPEDLMLNRKLGWHDLVHPDDLPDLKNQVVRAMDEGRSFVLTYRIITASGGERWVWERGVGVTIADSGLRAIEGIVLDVTERKRAEERLAVSEARFRQLAQASFEGILLTRNHIVYDCNKQLELMSGYSREELLGEHTGTFIHPEDREWMLEVAERGEEAPVECRGVSKSGREFVVECRIRQLGEDGADVLRITAIRDITERKRSELAMSRSLVFEQGLSRMARDLLSPAPHADQLQETLEYLLEAADVCRVYAFDNFHDPELGLCCRHVAEACAPGVEPQLGNPELQKVPYSVVPDWETFMRADKPVKGIASEMNEPLRSILLAQDIRSILVIPVRVGGEWSGFIGFDDTKSDRVWEPAEEIFLTTVAGIVGAYLERAVTERRLREALAEMDQIFNSTGEGMALIDLDHNILRINEPLVGMFGLDPGEVVGSKCHEVSFDERCGKDGCPLGLLSRGEEHTEFEYRISNRDGRGERFFNTTTNPFHDAEGRIVGIVSTTREVTDRVLAEQEAKVREQQLIQADKLAALGTLVTGVAHEINNPNGIITLNAPTLQAIWREVRPVLDHHFAKNGDFALGGGNYSDVAEDIDSLFEQVVESGRRIKRIVSELKGFARQEMADQSQSVDLNAVGQAAVGLVTNKLNKSTDRFTVDWHPGPLYVRGNFQRLEQVMVNGLINACEALTSRDQAITVSVRALPDEDTAEVVIEDQGQGLENEEVMNVFDPFFTTKRDSGGTGLGLSVSHGIVVEHGGSLQFDSRPGRGSRLVITLPREREMED